MGNDAPEELPEDNTYADCCQVTSGAMLGACVPSVFLTEAERNSAPQDPSCGGDEYRCPPKNVANGDPLPTCDPSGDFQSQGGGEVGVSACMDVPDYNPGVTVRGSLAIFGGVCMPECVLEPPDGFGITPEWSYSHEGQRGYGDCVENEEICIPCGYWSSAHDDCHETYPNMNVFKCQTGACMADHSDYSYFSSLQPCAGTVD